MEVKFVYQAGNVTGGYAFSANKPEITLPGYLENADKSMQDIAQFRAQAARDLYIEAVSAKKAAGEKVNPLAIKREAMSTAETKTMEKFGEEQYNLFKKFEDDNKGGNLSITGRKSKKGAKAPAKKTAKAAPAELPDDDLDDLEKEFADGQPDGMDAPASGAPDPFAEDGDDEI